MDGTRLSPSEIARLRERGWQTRVGRGTGLWVRVGRQELWLVSGEHRLGRHVCSTARAGIDCRSNSGGTPDGWLEVREMIGGDLPIGAILAGRRWTGAICRRFDEGDEDLVLTRVLRLAGLEPDHNLGGEVDTWDRLIYIHGTNAPGRLGTPASHGCVRLGNEAVVEIFDRVRVGCRVLVTTD